VGNSNDTPSGVFAEARLSEEPGAGKPHAGIRGGAAGKPAVLPRCAPSELGVSCKVRQRLLQPKVKSLLGKG